jgi:tetratricopeptide (TPR) repeat protein/tRNA A-37 threonylcarbamoyl transferase component Bud32
MAASAEIGRIARLLGGRFEVVRLLGEGALSEVYEADDLLLDERVAVKRLRSSWARDPAIVDRCKREVLAARRISHPNVCRVFDLVVAGAETGEPEVLLTMELLRGETLAERLERRGPLPAGEVLPLARQLCLALEAAHGAGVVHRDLKPSNVLLVAQADGGERAVVTDFGLARCLDGSRATLTAPGDLLGSPAYVAPEQVRGEPVTPAADLFGLGVLLYELVTGQLPFEGETAFETAMARLHRPPPRPGARAPGLPPAWDAAILRCLALAPEERFERPSAVLAALEGGAACGASDRPAAPDRPRDRQAAARAAVLVALLLGSGGAVSFRTLHSSAAVEPEPAPPEAAGEAAASPSPAAPDPADAAREAALDPLFASARQSLQDGDLEAAAGFYEEVLAGARSAGLDRSFARALAGLALVHSRRGDLEQAERLDRQALWLFRRIGDRKWTANVQNNLGVLLVRAGRLREAEALYREAAGLYAALGETVGFAAALNNRAELLLRQGHLAEAEELLHQALAGRRGAGDRRGEGVTCLALARLELERSHDLGARSWLERALETFAAEGHQDGIDEARLLQAEAALARGVPAEARGLLGEVLGTAREPSEGRRIRALIALSAVALAEGAPARAEALAREALIAAETAFEGESRVRALLALGRALEAAGRPAEALAVLAEAGGFQWGRQDRRLQIGLALAMARAEAAMGRPGEAGSRLRAALDEARWSGLTALSEEVRRGLDAVEPGLPAQLAVLSPP